jgi:enhancing lycopene biosynthesis protein 2
MVIVRMMRMKVSSVCVMGGVSIYEAQIAPLDLVSTCVDVVWFVPEEKENHVVDHMVIVKLACTVKRLLLLKK